MKFIVGVATGIVLGAAGAIAYSAKSGQDLREVAESVRSDLQQGTLGSRIERGIGDVQAQVEDRLGQVRASMGETGDTLETATDDAADRAADAIAQAGDAAEAVADDAAAAIEDRAGS